MKSTPLSFISDSQLKEYISLVIGAVILDESSAEKDIYRNVIDPFSALFDSGIQKISLTTWVEQEKTRQLQKSLQNAIGTFHQNVLGSMPGWDNLGIGQGFDLKNENKKIIAEVKNKFNTLNSKGLAAMYRNLDNSIRYQFKGYVAYYVYVVPKTPTPVDRPFAPNDDGRKLAEVEDIREMDGASFYDLASGESDTLRRLYTRVADLIADDVPEFKTELEPDGLLEEFFLRAYKGLSK